MSTPVPVSDVHMLAEDLRRRQRRHRRATPFWTLASLLFHTVGFLSLLLFTPMRELVMPEQRAATPPNLNAERLEQLAETIDDIHRSDLMAYVEELELARSEMDAVRQTMLEDYSSFAESQAEAAPETIEAFVNEAARLQQEAIAKQEVADADLRQASTPIQEVVNQQVLAKDTLEKAQQRAQLTGMAKTSEAMSQAVAAQDAANTKQVEAQRAVEAMRSAESNQKRTAEELAKTIEAVKAADEQVRKAESKLETAKADQVQADQRAEAAVQASEATRQEVEKAEAAHQQAKAETSTARKDRDKAAEKAAEQKAAGLQQQVDRARSEARKAAEVRKDLESKVRQAAANVQAAAKSVDSAKTQRERRATELAAVQAKVEPAAKAVTDTAEAAKTLQKDASEEQRKAAAELLKAARVAVSEAPAPEPVAVDAAVAALPPEVRRMDVVELYDLARALEMKVAESYRDVRAAEVAMLRAVPIEQARELTDVAQPVRPAIDAAILREATRTADAFEKRKAETATAVREAQGMVEASQSLLEVARSLAQDGTAFSAEGIAAMVAQQSAVSSAAAENESVRAKDLAALMQGSPAPAGSDQAAAPPAPEAVKKSPEKVESDDGSHLDRSKNHPLIDSKTPDVNPGTIAGDNSVATSWMFVDSWYTLGPFANPQRANIDRKFPPETVVDLDASYVGKDNRVIRWTYEKSARPCMIPANAEPYGIWYAYTELFFPEACDRWIAVGSDDKSKIWINDTLVWESVPWHKSWRINEGYRRVHFRQGRNRILYRIENGQHGIGWSLSVHLGDE